MTELRKKIITSMERYREILNPDNKGWQCLEVGIAGDEKPSGNFRYFGKGNNWQTLDNQAHFHPDIIADITGTGLEANQYDLIICSQTIEHIFDFQKVFSEVYRLLKPEGFAIIDCPFMFPYHGEEGFEDYWRMSDIALCELARKAGFGVVEYGMVDELSTGLFKKT